MSNLEPDRYDIRIQASCPYVILPKYVSPNRLLFVESLDGTNAVINSSRMIVLLLSVFSAAFFFGILFEFGTWTSILPILICAIGSAVLAIYLWHRTSHLKDSPRVMIVDPAKQRVAIRVKYRKSKAIVIESDFSQCKCILQPIQDFHNRNSVCLYVKLKANQADAMLPLGVMNNTELLEHYFQVVLGPLGLTLEHQTDVLSSWPAGAWRVLSSEQDVVAGICVCAYCKYDISQSASKLCPECGKRRAFP